MKKRNSSDLKSDLKVKTTVSLNKTKPAKARQLQRIQKSLSQDASKETPKHSGRIKPESQIARNEKLDLCLIPARIAFAVNALYYLLFSLMAFLAVFSNYKLIKPFFTLPFDTTFSSFFLLELAAMFSLLASLLHFHAARKPLLYRWLYFFLIIVFLPYHFLSDWQKLQIELPQDFQSYLYFDTIFTSVLWVVYMLSLYPYLKPTSTKN